MNEYVIMTDSAADLTLAQCEALSVVRADLTVTIGDSSPRAEREVEVTEFYAALREKKTTRTAAMNLDDFVKAAEPILESGKDILYLGFSSGLSSTYQSGRLAAEELSERYPDRKIYTVDSLCASLGGGLFVDLVAQKRDAGASLSEARDYAEALTASSNCVPALNSWFLFFNFGYVFSKGNRYEHSLKYPISKRFSFALSSSLITTPRSRSFCIC